MLIKQKAIREDINSINPINTLNIKINKLKKGDFYSHLDLKVYWLPAKGMIALHLASSRFFRL
ncbi:MAG: hypothetical protein Roseis2KO_45850 [Roseivirga sp.]